MYQQYEGKISAEEVKLGIMKGSLKLPSELNKKLHAKTRKQKSLL